jgi:hypothetical protein
MRLLALVLISLVLSGCVLYRIALKTECGYCISGEVCTQTGTGWHMDYSCQRTEKK